MCFSVLIGPWWKDTNALSFKEWKTGAAEIKNDMAHIRISTLCGEAVVALDSDLKRIAEGVQIDHWLRGRGGRFCPATCPLVGLGEKGRYRVVQSLDSGFAVCECFLGWELHPRKL